MARRTDIAVVAWNNCGLTERCLASIRRGTKGPYRIILVDNGSTDGVKDIQSGEDIAVIRNQGNLGWVTAANQAREEFLKGDADRFVLSNNDCEYGDGWDEAWLRHFARDPRVGAVAPASPGISGAQHPTYAHADRKWHSAHFLIYASVMFSREAIEKVGGLDPRFEGLGSDDWDHSIRMRDAGYRLIVDRSTEFIHRPHSSFVKKLGGMPTVDYWRKGNGVLEQKVGVERVKAMFEPKPAVLFAIPSVASPSWQWITQFAGLFSQTVGAFPCAIVVMERQFIDLARNIAGNAALKGDVDYLFFLDDDTMPPPDTVKAFVMEDKDIIFAQTFQRDAPFDPCALVYNEKVQGYSPLFAVGRGIVEVDAVGMAATLIHTGVLARTERPWFRWQSKSPRLGTEIGEDMRFCELAKDAGASVWADSSRICWHERVVRQTTDWRDFKEHARVHRPDDYRAIFGDK